MDVQCTGVSATRATFIPMEAHHTDLDLIISNDSICMLQNMPFRGQIVMSDYTGGILSVCLCVRVCLCTPHKP